MTRSDVSKGHPEYYQDYAARLAREIHDTLAQGFVGISSQLDAVAMSMPSESTPARGYLDLARQQLEFVATVSHELRTPLAVIRSAADNLADGVVNDEARVRQYGQLVRREGLRLTLESRCQKRRRIVS